ncbi:MAG: hypothetical protein ACPGUE_20680, partial [Marinomonas sp.]
MELGLKSKRIKMSAVLLSLLLLWGCEKAEQKSAQAMGSILGPVNNKEQNDKEQNEQNQNENNQNEQFTPVTKDVEITFPADHQAHPSFRHEWWYLTA